MASPPEIIRQILAHAFDVFPIDAVYLHGSYALDAQDSESDLDLAILADATLSKEERRRLRMDVFTHLVKLLGERCPEPDVIVLQDVPVLLQFNVIRKGTPLFTRERGRRLSYELAVEQAYDDEHPAMAREAEMTIARILSHVTQ